jgi:hypothetical protein
LLRRTRKYNLFSRHLGKLSNKLTQWHQPTHLPLTKIKFRNQVHSGTLLTRPRICSLHKLFRTMHSSQVLDRRPWIFKRHLYLHSIATNQRSEQTHQHRRGLSSPNPNNNHLSLVSHNKPLQLRHSSNPRSTHSSLSQHRASTNLSQLRISANQLLRLRSDNLPKLNNGEPLNKHNSNQLLLPSFKLLNSQLLTRCPNLDRVRHLPLDSPKVCQTSSLSSQFNSHNKSKMCPCFLNRNSQVQHLSGWSRT